MLPFVPAVMERVQALMHTDDPHLREPVLSVVASVAASAEGHFAPHAEALLPLMPHLMAASGPGAPEVRARATECAGLLLSCLGPDRAVTLAQEPARVALQALASTSSHELREYCFGFFGQLAEAAPALAGDVLAAVLPAALAATEQDDGAPTRVGPGGGGRGGGAGESSGAEGSDSDDEDDSALQLAAVRTGLVEEKCAATQCIGKLAGAAGAAFGPSLPAACRAVEAMCGHFHEEVR